MLLTKIHMYNCNGIPHPPMQRKVEGAPSDMLVLVPDMDSFHEISGMGFLLNKNWQVHLLEPGESLRFMGMYSPWHLNTDGYRLVFENHIATYKER